jgi:hypothetical protein
MLKIGNQRKRPDNHPEVCGNCHADIPPDACACPSCGADRNTGWDGEGREEEGDFDYDEFVRREFGGQSAKPAGIAWYWWLTAIGLLLFSVLSAFLALL